jgi:hypothetical protein
MPKCLLCNDGAIAIFRMPGGCYVYQEETIQPLCPQHIIQARPQDGMYMIEDLRADKTYAVPDLHLPGLGETVPIVGPKNFSEEANGVR